MKLSGHKTLGLILAITGSALIVFSVSMYILGIYSKSNLDDLNASIQVANIDTTKIVVIDDKNTNKDFVHAKEESHNSFIAPDNKPVKKPEKTISLTIEKKEYPNENNLFFLTPQPESTNLEIQVQF